MGWAKHNRHKTLAAGALIGANLYTGKMQPVADFEINNRAMRRLKGERGKKRIIGGGIGNEH